ncbi:hypothetical protein [Halomonas korlensis]|uniref:Mannonate dehydratase n=1 Tax=Halomonas korlensis TaxID=463301 RepID=A0A1I7KLG9_9GAMM|nr:mannonate dehydratase [Halomonas korlensis]
MEKSLTRFDRQVPPDGGRALRFDQVAFAVFDLYLLARPGAEAEYADAEKEVAKAYLETLDPTIWSR